MSKENKNDKSDIIDVLSVGIGSSSLYSNYTTFDHINAFIILVLKYSLLVGLLTINFLGLSAALNCNADQSIGTRIFSAIFGFFFGFVYLLVNYYTYKVMTKGKICVFRKDTLFPI